MSFDIQGWFDQARAVFGSNGGDNLKAEAYARVLIGFGGNDTLTAEPSGGTFDLGFWGGPGNDTLVGSYARDAYLYLPGDGQDTIRDDVRSLGSRDVDDYFYAHSDDPNYQDYLVFGLGISPSDVTPQRSGDDLVLQVRGGSVRIEGWFQAGVFTQVENIVFANGTTWTSGSIMQQLDAQHEGVQMRNTGDLQGSPYADSLTALSYGAHLVGGEGNDHLAAAAAGGIFAVDFDGGRGDDMIIGSYAGDTYHYSRGDGKDVIVDDVRNLGSDSVNEFFLANSSTASYQDTLAFGSGIAPSDVLPTRNGDDLVLAIKGASGDEITVRNFFDGTIFGQIETFQFADGSAWTAGDVVDRVAPAHTGVNLRGAGVLTGTQLADTLTATAWGTELRGGDGNDTLGATVNGAVFNITFNGGKGDDVITGSYGGDTYIFSAGDGHDTISDSVRMYPTPGVAEYFLAHPDDPSYRDRIQVNMPSSAVTRSDKVGNDWVIEFGQSDSITIKDEFDGTILSRIEIIGFSDGVSLIPI